MWFLSLLFSQVLFAETLNFKPLVYSNEEVKEISIHGVDGSIRVTGDSGKAESLQIQIARRNSEGLSDEEKEFYEEWTFTYKNENGHLQLFINEPMDKEKLIKSTNYNSSRSPKYDIQIQGPSKPLKIWWKEGQVSFLRWNQPLKVVQQKGKILLTEVQSSAALFLNEGQVSLTKVKGAVELESYKAKYQISEFDGNLKLDSFAGQLKLNQTSGSLQLHNHSGFVDISNSKGQVDFNVGNSKVFIKKFNGDVHGKTDSGSVEAELFGAANVRIQSVDGPVSISLPQSAASVNIGSKKGQLVAPQYLRSSQYSSLKTVTGQLRGRDEGGRIYVRSEGGNIRIR